MSQPIQEKPILLISPLFLGVLAGLVVMTFTLPGGYDGWLYYFQAWFPNTTAPAWVHLLLAPLTWLPDYPAPYRWMVMVLLTALVVRLGVWVFGGRWLWAILSLPFLWTVWLGQIEFIPILGVVLMWWGVHKKIHPAWIGVALLALATKVQVGWGIGVLGIFWLMIEKRWRDLLWMSVSATWIVLLTVLIYPNWIMLWLESLRLLAPSGRYFDSSIFPLGVVAWGVALFPIVMTRQRRLRLVACATLLSSPYFAIYHCITVLVVANHPRYWAVSWVPFLPIVLFDNQRFGWIIPLFVLLYEGWLAYRGCADD